MKHALGVASSKDLELVSGVAQARSRLRSEIQESSVEFPALTWMEREKDFLLKGIIVLEQGGVPFDEYEIELQIPHEFPALEPKLFEVGGRIEKTADRHINDDGSACYEVFEYWLATTSTPTVSEFLRTPVVNFFLSQTIFELSGEWPFRQRSHGIQGLFEATAEALGIECDADLIANHLRVLRDWPSKGHHDCPCSSGRRFRDCHRDELKAVHQKIPPELAKRFVDRIVRSLKTAEKPAQPEAPIRS